MAFADLHDLPLSTSSEAAARRYRDGQALMLASWTGADAAFDDAIAADPDFALAHAARARLFVMSGETDRAREVMKEASALAERLGDERERSHVDMLATLTAGQSKGALSRALAHTDRWPRDALILATPLGAFGLFAFSGMADHTRAWVELCSRHAGHFEADDWWFLTAYGWGLVEIGELTRGRAMLERALELRRDSASTAHALAHALYESGAGREADDLIGGWLPGYDRAGILHGHIAWHAALLALERGDPDQALRLYRDNVHPSVSHGMAINIVSDAASLLWRLGLYGHEPPEGAWAEVADYASHAFPRPGHPFIDIHMAMIEAATDKREALNTRVAALEAMASGGRIAAGPVVPAFARAALAFADGDYTASATHLETLADEAVRIGGSGAQRDIVEDTLLVALVRSGETGRAANLLKRRLGRRPTAGDARWRTALVGVA